MGLFARIYSNYPLPDLPSPELQIEEFQTKDLDVGELFGRPPFYLITESGHLGVYPEDPEAKGFDVDDMHYSGTIRFYTIFPEESFQADRPKSEWWVEYEARFVGGKLISLMRVRED